MTGSLNLGKFENLMKPNIRASSPWMVNGEAIQGERTL